jgi:hypothetical protein
MANEKNLEKQLADFMTQNGLSLGDLRKILQGIMFDRSVAGLEALKKDKTVPAAISFIASALLSDMARGHLDTLNSLLDICYGKPVQVVEVRIHDAPADA